MTPYTKRVYSATKRMPKTCSSAPPLATCDSALVPCALSPEASSTTEEPRCPICLTCQQRDGREQPMVLTSSTFRPSWRDLFYGPDHPPWFES